MNLLKSIAPPTGPRFALPAPPPSVDLRPWAPPVRDQSNEGACTGFAFAGLREWWEAATTGKPAVTLSPQFVYYEERLREGDVTEDAGADPNDGCRMLQQYGAAPESDEPYVAGQINVAPSAQELQAALAYRITGWSSVTTLDEIRAALAAHHPVALGILVLPCFMQTSDGGPNAGLVTAPPPGSLPGLWEPMGGHLIACYGYDDDRQVLILRNSWGATHGDRGDYYLPYSYFSPPIAQWPEAKLQPTLMGGWVIEVGELPSPLPGVTPVIDRTHPVLVVAGQDAGKGEIRDGETWGPIRTVVELLGATIHSESTSTGERVIVIPKA